MFDWRAKSLKPILKYSNTVLLLLRSLGRLLVELTYFLRILASDLLRQNFS